MEKLIAEVKLRCPKCGSDNVHIVVGTDAGDSAIFAEDAFDDRDDTCCGECHHKDEAAAFIAA